MRRRTWAVLILVTAAACGGGGGGGGDDDGDDDVVIDDVDAADPGPGTPDATASQPGDPDASPGQPEIDAGGTPVVVAPGAGCSCDADCEGVSGHDGICVFGICMTRASTTCSAGGSSPECGAGSRCWGLEGEDGSICWPDCASYDCAGACDGDGSCVPTTTTDCDYACGTYCSCGAGDCAEGEMCSGGDCIPDAGDGPGPGPGPACAGLPPMNCTGTAAYCGELIAFDPRTTTGYDDYPINGETASNQYRSFLRRDVVMLIKYASAKVACKAVDWDSGHGGPVGLGDMSEADGSIPGTSIGEPGHPAGTHEDGRDIDMGYYQTGTPDNRLRPICEHTIGGVEQNHCTADPIYLDKWRQALYIGFLFEHPQVRVVGVDGKAGPILEGAISTLCDEGWITDAACTAVSMAYETTDMGYGWYYFHLHHMHLSWNPPASFAPAGDGAMPCEAPGCRGVPLKANSHRWGAKAR